MSWTFHRLQFQRFGKTTARLVLLAHWSTDEEILVVYLMAILNSLKFWKDRNSCRSNVLFVWLWPFTLWNNFSNSGVQRRLKQTTQWQEVYLHKNRACCPRKIYSSKYGLYSTVCRLLVKDPYTLKYFDECGACETSLKQYSKVWSCTDWRKGNQSNKIRRKPQYYS